MNKKDFRAYFDSVSPDASIVKQTEKEIENMLNKKEAKHISLRTACIVLAACLILTGTALAVTNAAGILERLFRNGEPSEKAVGALVTNAAQASQNGVTLNLDEYLIDQNTMHLGWTVTSERDRDVYYTTAYELIYTNPADEALAENSIGGHYGATTSIEVGNDMMARLCKDSPSFSGFADYGYNGSLTSPVQVKVIVRAYETDYAPCKVGNVMELYDMESELVRTLEKEKKIGVDALNRSSVGGYSAFAEARDKRLAEGMEIDAASETALVESGIFGEVAVIEVCVAVQPGQAAEARYSLSEPMQFELAHAAVILKQLTVDSASTIIEYDVLTDRAHDASGILADGLYFILFDQNGRPLTSDYGIGMEGGETEPMADGRRVWNILHSGNPIPENVTAITFVPKGTLKRLENEPSNEYFLRIKDNAAEDECFTVFLGE